ncbi:MAG: hypothetical protein HY403_01735, partial [Elusimicrobia bacterium]|nr:hypothetical protein [Elusimicrobiota bacterium]
DQNSMTMVSGTAADNVGLDRVRLRILNVSPLGTFWNNGTSGFDSGLTAENAWFDATPVTADTTTWRKDFGFTSGMTYRFEARAKDKAGNMDAVYATTRTFLYDATLPLSYVEAPGNNALVNALPQITGTANDGGTGSGVNAVYVAIRNNVLGQWWGGGDWNQPSPQDFPTVLSGGGPWGWTWAGPGAGNLASGTSYYITSRSVDDALNQESYYNVRGSTFSFDNVRPTAGLTSPNAAIVRSLSSLSGTASDDFAGIQDVELFMHDETQPNTAGWWDGTAFVGGAAAPIAVSTDGPGTSWTYTDADLGGALSSGKRYLIYMRARDKATNEQNAFAVNVSSRVVRFDNVTPSVVVQQPVMAPSTATAVLSTISGTADDPAGAFGASGVTTVHLKLIDSVDNTVGNGDDVYWNGGAFASHSTNSVQASGATSWNYNSAGVPWTSNRRYGLYAYAVDNAGNPQASFSTFTFVYDTTPPASWVTRPSENAAHSTVDVLSTISGTSDDQLVGAQVGKVEISIRLDEAPLGDSPSAADRFWNTTLDAFDDPSEVWHSTGTTPFANWTFTAPAWTSGKSYVIRTRATDKAGGALNVESAIPVRHFTVDLLPPDTFIESPADAGTYGSLATITGTAEDSPAGVRKVDLCIKYFGANNVEEGAGCAQGGSDDGIWRHGDNAFNFSGSSWNAANGAASWSYGNVIWPATGRFRIIACGTDNAGNLESACANSVFSIDNYKPTASIAVPAHGASYKTLAALNGTASDWSGGGGATQNPYDTGIGATGVEVAIASSPHFNTWWNGGGWQATTFWSPQPFVGTTSGTWSYSVGLPSFISGTRYRVLARAIDRAGNTQDAFAQGVSSNVFSFDSVGPTSRFTVPVDLAARRTLSIISGTAEDDFSGLNPSDVKLRITDSVDNVLDNGNDQYWTGAAWGAESERTASFLGESSGTWSYTDASLSGAWTSGRLYRLFTYSRDRAQNYELPGSTITFLFDTATSVPVTTQPVAGAEHGPLKTIPTFAGTAADSPAHDYAQLTQVQLRVRRSSNGEYWSGGGWTSTEDTWNVAGGTGTWSYPMVTPLEDATQYELNVRSLDRAGNISVPYSTTTFIWDSTVPQVLLQEPNAVFEPAELSILSGTAEDPGAGLKADLASVELSIQINPGAAGNFWTGTGFLNPGETWLAPTAGLASWSFTGSTPTWVSGTEYRVRARSKDGADNVSAIA